VFQQSVAENLCLVVYFAGAREPRCRTTS